ncbi:hypothetical protein [Amycolatopsis anabasis]|uniref:hypothetical protein n=1 Tax=Amycolatopsis anabasis TaxID=1840409 RepID=UPI00131E4D8A|nr:hypothetical protein [Amycolatopsis anabasis]
MPVSHDDFERTKSYVEEHPEFEACRRKGHDYPDEDDVPLVEAYNDASATHHKVFTCPTCKAKKRQRFQIKIRRGRVVSFIELDARGDYSEAKGYVARGTRIKRRSVREVAIRRDLEAQLASARKQAKVPAQRQPAARSGRKRAAA